MIYYHGTSLKNAKNILANKKFFIKDTLGTLGFGTYAFEYSKNNAIEFARNKLNRGRLGNSREIALLSFKVDNSNVFDMNDPANIEFLHNYIESHKNEIDFLKEINGTNGYSKKLDGAIIDSFIK